MKNVTAVICELNPLHKGHEYIIRHAREDADVLVLVMSGSFTQRSVPAVFDRYVRAEAAVRCGADLVVELPFPWCSYGVEGFARGGCAVAAAMGAGRLVFGSESGDFALLEKVADIKDSPGFGDAMKDADGGKKGSAEVFESVLRGFGVREELGPNDKLGAEYVRYGRRYGIGGFVPVKRRDSESASVIRDMMADGGKDVLKDLVPAGAYAVYENAAVCSSAEYDRILFTYARLQSRGEDPIMNHAVAAAQTSGSPEEFISSLPTKKYTLSRIRRHILLRMTGAPADDGKLTPDFSYLLAADGKGIEYLNFVKKDLPVSLVTKPADAAGNTVGTSMNADGIFAMCSGEKAGYLMKKSPVIIL